MTQDGQTYGHTGNFSGDDGGTVKVSCVGGPVLIEAASPSWISSVTVGLASLVGLT